MTKRYLAGAVIGLLADLPDNPDSLHASMEQPPTEMYIALDSAEIYESTGSAFVKVGDIASASAAYPGVATDAADGLAVTGTVQAADITASGPGGSTPSITATQASGQTGYLYEGVNSSAQTKFSVAVDGEVLTADDLLAPTGTVKGATLAFAPTGSASAPASGAHNAGEMVMGSTGSIFVCTVSGTPGTWKTVTVS